jgi:hypothetical protein
LFHRAGEALPLDGATDDGAACRGMLQLMERTFCACDTPRPRTAAE